MTELDSADDEWIASLLQMTKEAEAARAIAPKSKLHISHNEAEQAVYAAIRNAYAGGQPGWCPEPDDYEMPAFGDLDELLYGKGRFYLDHDHRMLAIGNIISGGISKLIENNDPQAPDKIRRLTQIAVAAGYLFALLDDKEADKRRPKRGTKARSSKKDKLAEKVRQYAMDNPNATQKEIGAVFKRDPRTIRSYLNK